MENSQSTLQLVAYWKRNGLSTRASYVLAKAGISETQLASYRDLEALVHIKNCGAQTAQEIWDLMTNRVCQNIYTPQQYSRISR